MSLDEYFRGIFRDELRQVVRDELRLVRTEAPRVAPPPAAALFTVKQVGAKLGCEPATVRSYIEDGSLLATKPKGRWMVRPEDLETFLGRKEAKRAPSSDEQLAALVRKVQGG